MPSLPQRAKPSSDDSPPARPPVRLVAIDGREVDDVGTAVVEKPEGGRTRASTATPVRHAPGHTRHHRRTPFPVEHFPPAAPPRRVAPPPPPPVWRVAVKRTLDVIGGIVGLALSVPILAVLAVLIRLESAGAVVFAQTRVGRDGRAFRCYKLRTMCADAEALLERDSALRAVYEAHAFKLPTHIDRRITPLGRILRETSLDELPQFWNVLRGDMSLVGPRPIVHAELVHYESTQDTLLSVRPGLTGAWAVRGRSQIGYPQRADIELEYVRRWTLLGDLAILARTVVAVAQRRGAY